MVSATMEAGGMLRWTRAVVGVALAWMLVVMIVAVAEAIRYTGLVAALGEWQFDHLGQFYPAITLLLLVGLFFLPALVVLVVLERRRHAAQSLDERGRLIRRSWWGIRVFALLAALLAVAALVVLLRMLVLPSSGGAIGRVEAGVTPAQGPAVLAGRYRYDHIATFRQNILVARREYRFVPVQPVRASAATAIALFAQTDVSQRQQRPAVEQHGGILRRAALPHAVERLYQDAGYVVAPDAYVLYADAAAMRWPFVVAAVQLALTSFILAVAALMMRRRHRLLVRG